ncbi:hypothetical protein PC116_g30914 [Phytophthora cactorum]|nr:hypothetical protein PC116_g30914 [Phytophthora cactorum]
MYPVAITTRSMPCITCPSSRIAFPGIARPGFNGWVLASSEFSSMMNWATSGTLVTSLGRRGPRTSYLLTRLLWIILAPSAAVSFAMSTAETPAPIMRTVWLAKGAGVRYCFEWVIRSGKRCFHAANPGISGTNGVW